MSDAESAPIMVEAWYFCNLCCGHPEFGSVSVWSKATLYFGASDKGVVVAFPAIADKLIAYGN